MGTTPPVIPVIISKTSLEIWIIRLALIAALIFGCIYAFDSLIANHDAAKANASQIALEAVVKSNVDYQTSAATLFAQIEQQIVALGASNKILQTAQVTRATQTDKQQQQDANLTVIQASQRLNQLEPKQPPAVVNTNGSLIIGLPLTQAVIQDLDSIPGLKADNAGLTQELVNDTTIITDLHTELNTDDGEITGLKSQITAQDKASKTEIAALKSSARKGKLKWFGIGFIAGFVVREGILLGVGR
jgi:hypothetical protein